jgi:uncharacterized membrane protein YhaH (DUF805 family)
MALVGIIAATTPETTLSVMMAPIMVVGFGAIFINILLTIQRCHDFNFTGWLSLISADTPCAVHILVSSRH